MYQPTKIPIAPLAGIIFFLLFPGSTSLWAQLEDWDTDQDAMPNGYEYYGQLNENDPKDAWEDPDGDGICNLYEYFLATDPQDRYQPTFVNFNPENSLSEAIRKAGKGVVLRIPAGNYDLNYRHESQSDPPRLLLQGGWNPEFTEQDHCLYPTVLNGNNQGAIFDFLIVEGNSAALLLDGFTLTGGSSGAIQFTGYLSKIQLLLANCRVLGNGSHRASAILNFADGAGSSLISDLVVVNTLLAGNFGTAIKVQQNATRTNFKFLHSIVTSNNYASNDGPPFTSGYGMNIYPDSDSTFNIQVANSILWGNANLDFEVNNLEGQNIGAEIRNNLLGFLKPETDFTLFSHPSNRYLDPLFEQTDELLFSMSNGSPAIRAGMDIGFFPEEAPDIGVASCEDFLSTTTDITEKIETEWSVSPNPSQTGFHLNGRLNDSNNLHLALYNAWGQKVHKEDHATFGGSNIDIWVPTGQLQSGFYYLEIRYGHQKTTKRLSVIK